MEISKCYGCVTNNLWCVKIQLFLADLTHNHRIVRFCESGLHWFTFIRQNERLERGQERNQTSALSPAVFTCYFQTLGIGSWISFTSHHHGHSRTVFKPNWHGTRQLFIDNCLHNFIQITFQQWKNYLQK